MANGNEGDIVLTITLDDGSIIRGIGKAEQAAKESGKSIEQSFQKSLGSGFSFLSKQVLAFGAAFVTAFAGKKVIDAAIEKDAAITRLNQTLANAGSFSEKASQSFLDFANVIQSTTIVSDDAAIAAISLARGFTKTNEQAKELVKTAIDLSAAREIPLSLAVEELGKTFNGTGGKLSSFVPNLKLLTETQLKAGAAIAVVAQKYNNFANIEVNTLSGAITQITNTFNSFLSTIGLLIIKSPLITNAIKLLLTAVQSLSGVISTFSDAGGFQKIIVGAASFFLVFKVIPKVQASLLGLGATLRYVSFQVGQFGAKNVLAATFKQALAAVFSLNTGLKLLRVGLALTKAAATLGLTIALDFLITKALELKESFGSFGAAASFVFLSLKLSVLDFVKNALAKIPFVAKAFGDGSAINNAIEETKLALADLDKQKKKLAEAANPTLPTGIVPPTPTGGEDARAATLNQFLESNKAFVAENKILFLSYADDIENVTAAQLAQINAVSLSASEKLAANLEVAKKKTEETLNVQAQKTAQTFSLISNVIDKLIEEGLTRLGGALVGAGGGFKSFVKAAGNILGDFFIQFGLTIIAADQAIIALKASLVTFFGGLGIAAGIGLVIAGGALKALSGGPSSTSGAGGGVSSASGGGSAISSAPVTTGIDDLPERGPQIAVNIQGNILDRRQTGLEIADILRESFDGNAVVFNT